MERNYAATKQSQVRPSIQLLLSFLHFLCDILSSGPIGLMETRILSLRPPEKHLGDKNAVSCNSQLLSVQNYIHSAQHAHTEQTSLLGVSESRVQKMLPMFSKILNISHLGPTKLNYTDFRRRGDSFIEPDLISPILLFLDESAPSRPTLADSEEIGETNDFIWVRTDR